MLTIAVDAMGGDAAPRVVVEGAADALEKLPADQRIRLVGDPDALNPELQQLSLANNDRIEIAEASEVIHMEDSPAKALRTKKDSSISVGTHLTKEGEADAFVSAGNTGAVVGSSILKLRALPNVERPGIATVFPSPTGPFVLLDAGAHMDAKPLHLVHYALMGEAYAQKILNIPSPRIGLLNVGAEESKGNELTKNTYQKLKEIPELNFVGNVEGHDLFENRIDVVICDGFVGNVVLKCCESLANGLNGILKQCLKKTFIRKLGALISRNAFYEMKAMSDRDEYGGAPLLGVNGVCIIGHGSSSRRAIQNAILVASNFVQAQVNDTITKRIQDISDVAQTTAASTGQHAQPGFSS